jgi:hypothetical protein
LDKHKENFSLFSNIQSKTFWTSTEFAGNFGYAWYFGFSNGIQLESEKVAECLFGQFVIVMFPLCQFHLQLGYLPAV